MEKVQDYNKKKRVRKWVYEFRSKSRSWKLVSSKEKWNPFCKVENKTFLGWDSYYNRSAWRKVKIFSPNFQSSKNPIVLVPPTGGVNLLDQILATFLAQNGYTVIIFGSFEGWNDYSDEVTRHDRQSLQSIAALKELENWIGHPFHVIGASLGAMYALQAFANDSLIKKMVLVVGGEKFPDILAESKLPIAVNNKIDRRRKFNLKSQREYRDFMNQNFSVEPGLFAEDEKNGAKYLLFIAERDKVVPTKYQKSLAEKLTGAKEIHLKSGHVLTVLRSYLLYQKEILNFLEQ